MRDRSWQYLWTAAATMAMAAITTVAPPAAAFDGWHLEQATVIEGKGSAWDYVSLDSARDRLFIGSGYRRLGWQAVIQCPVPQRGRHW